MSGLPSPTGPAAGGPPGGRAAGAPRCGLSYGRALLATLVWVALAMVVLLGFAATPATAREARSVVLALVVLSLLSALPTWLVARRLGVRRFWLLVLLALPALLLWRVFFGVIGATG